MAHGAADVNGSPQAFLRAAIPSDTDCLWRDVRTLALGQAPGVPQARCVYPPVRSRRRFHPAKPPH